MDPPLTYITDKDHQRMEKKLNVVGVSFTADGREQEVKEFVLERVEGLGGSG